MRKLLLLGLLAALVPAAMALAKPSRPTLTGACAKTNLSLVNDGQLTIGTDNPAYPPWFGGNPGHGWKVSDPYSGKGYESAVAYAVAKQLGFTRAQVKWTYVPFAKAFAPGRKSFDFDINQVSYDATRAKVVTFSASYYDDKQSIVVRKGTDIARVRSVAGLRPYTISVQLGTTSYQFVKSVIRPKSIKVYNTNDKAVFALKNKLVDGVVVDLPTAFYVTAVQVPNSKILGQFAQKTGEHFGMVFQKGNSLVGCVNKALAAIKANGTLRKIDRTWLSKVVGVPVLK